MDPKASYTEYNALSAALKSKHYIHVPLAIPHAQIQSAMSAFFKFLELPEHIKNHIDFTIAKYHRRGDVGYKHRKAADSIYNDNKDFFHYHPSVFEKYADFIRQNPVVESFLRQAEPIWEQVYQLLHKIISAFEPHHPGILGRIFETEYPHILLRFLKYEWASSGQYLAKPHYDAGSFTLAIAESCAGLRIGSDPNDLQLVEHKPGEAIFMLSSNYKQVCPDQSLKPSWHDVIQLDQSKIGKPYARWALVAFIEAHDVYALPRSETHKWMVDEASEPK